MYWSIYLFSADHIWYSRHMYDIQVKRSNFPSTTTIKHASVYLCVWTLQVNRSNLFWYGTITCLIGNYSFSDIFLQIFVRAGEPQAQQCHTLFHCCSNPTFWLRLGLPCLGGCQSRFALLWLVCVATFWLQLGTPAPEWKCFTPMLAADAGCSNCTIHCIAQFVMNLSFVKS